MAPKLRDFLRISEAAEYLGVSPNTLRNWERAGKIAGAPPPGEPLPPLPPAGPRCAAAARWSGPPAGIGPSSVDPRDDRAVWAEGRAWNLPAGTSSRPRSTSGNGVVWTSSATALPDHDPYRAWSNFEFQADDGAIYEVDLLVLTKQGFWLVECKAWEGRITGDSGSWTRIARTARPGPRTTPSSWPTARRRPSPPCSRPSPPSSKVKAALARRPRLPLGRRPPVRPHRPGPQPGLPQGPPGRGRPPRAQGHPRRPPQPGLSGRRSRPPLDHRHQGRQGVVPCDGAGGHPPLAAGTPGGRLRAGRPDRRWAGLSGLARQARLVRRTCYCRVRQYTVAQASSEEDRQRLRRAAAREFQIIQTLDHPGILPVLDYKEHENGPALLFRYLDPNAVRFDHYLATNGHEADHRPAARPAPPGRRRHPLRPPQAGDPPGAEPPEHPRHRRRVADARGSRSTTGRSASGRRPRPRAGSPSSRIWSSPKPSSTCRPRRSRTPARSPRRRMCSRWGPSPSTCSPPARPPTNPTDLARILREQKGLSISSVLDGAGPKLEELIQWSTHPDVLTRIGSVEDFLTLLDDVEDELTAPAEAVVVDPLQAKRGDRLRTRLRRASESSARGRRPRPCW